MTSEDKHIEIRRLLQQWYEASLSHAQEARLIALMQEAGSRLPSDLKADRDMLLALAAMPKVSEPTIDQSRDNITRLFTQMPEENEVPATKQPLLRRRRFIWLGLSAAAIAALLISLPMLRENNNTPTPAVLTTAKTTIANKQPPISTNTNKAKKEVPTETIVDNGGKTTTPKVTVKKHIARAETPDAEIIQMLQSEPMDEPVLIGAQATKDELAEISEESYGNYIETYELIAEMLEFGPDNESFKVNIDNNKNTSSTISL